MKEVSSNIKQSQVQSCIQNPVEHLKHSVLRKHLTVFSG